MVKPIDVNEMLWRVEALLRRCQAVSQRKTKLGNTELAASPNRIFTRRQIMEDVHGVDSNADTHTLEVHISKLRDRFKDNPDFEIATVRGLGYKVVKKHE